MSKNYNRAKTKNILCNKTYKHQQLVFEYGWYYEEYGMLKSGLWPVQYRTYRTWKHTRKTQYKNKY